MYWCSSDITSICSRKKNAHVLHTFAADILAGTGVRRGAARPCSYLLTNRYEKREFKLGHYTGSCNYLVYNYGLVLNLNKFAE